MKNKYTVYPDSHAFRLCGLIWEPPYINRNKKVFRWRVKFDRNCLYSFGMPDQRDWNKGGGVSFNLFTNHKDSAMWGWRANDGGGIDLTAYCHVDGERKVFKDGLGEVVMVCAPNDNL